MAEEKKQEPVSNKELLDAMKSMLVEVIKETKKPTELEQKKLDEEKARTIKREKMLLQQAQQEEARKKSTRSGCAHRTVHPNGNVHHAWRSQVNTPYGEEAYFIPTCSICGFQTPKVKATVEQLREGVQLHAYHGLTKEMLEDWAKNSKWEKKLAVA